MLDMFLSEEGAPHPLVMAIIAISLTVMCFGGCYSTKVSGYCIAGTPGIIAVR